MIFYTRVLNLVLGVAMIVVSLLSLLTTDNMTTGVLACYVVVFACLLCCFESGLQVVLRVIALNFGFMYRCVRACVCVCVCVCPTYVCLGLRLHHSLTHPPHHTYNTTTAYSARARAVFMLFVGSILFSFSLFGKIVGIAMLANAGACMHLSL